MEINIMEVQVLFAERNAITGDIENYDHVANVDAPDHYDTESALEYAFRRLQNIEGSWSMGPNLGFTNIHEIDNPDYDPNITVLKPFREGEDGRKYGHRSCSLFDRMIVDGKIFEVDSFGFKEIV
jgi:hypothetical protein